MSAEACPRTPDHGHDLDTDGMRERFAPWFHAVEVVSARSPVPEPPAVTARPQARLPRACGRYEPAFAPCGRADAVERVMWTAVARATTRRVRGDLDQTAAVFACALTLDPANCSLHLDPADVRAEQGGFAAAVGLAAQGLQHEPHEVSLRAAATACRTRPSGSSGGPRAPIALAPELANTAHRDLPIDYAGAGPKLSRRLVTKTHRVRRN